jgi:hypothetical protein
MRVSGAPVRIDESAYAARVVAMISSSRPSPISAATRFAIIWKNGTTSIIMLPFAPAKPLPPAVYTTCATSALTKNMDTPAGASACAVNAPAAGKMSIPYDTPSSTFSSEPSSTAGSARAASTPRARNDGGDSAARVCARARWKGESLRGAGGWLA